MSSTITRKEFIRTVGISGAALAQSRWLDAAAPNQRPNIIFIISDQQRAGMMSCTGNPYLKTPAMDRLAASGRRFEMAYSANPVCLPARFSFFTGRMPSAVGIRHNEDRTRGVPEEIAAKSMGRLFKDAGYETVYGGKIHLPRVMELDKIGFRNLTRDERGKLADECAQFIKQPHERPFLLVASFINPHDICYMAINDHLRSQGKRPIDNVASKIMEELIEGPRKNLTEFVEKHCPPLPDNFEVPELEPECITEKYVKERTFRWYAREKWSQEMWRLFRWAYCRLTEMVDEEIGRVLAAVRDAGIEGNTLIVFTSDHGDHDSAHRLEHKSILYEGAARVPFIMSYRGVIPAGAVDEAHLVSNGLDLLPTLCDYAGIVAPEDLLGASVRPLAEGKAVSSWRDHLVVESQNGRMIRTARFKYNVYDSGEHREQLIDLKNDPGEMKNLAYDGRHKAILEQHRELLATWVDRAGDAIGKEYVVR
jgi:arylsulfatase A-like enzyme